MPQKIKIEETDRKFAYALILKAYEHHKTHARFEETQRSWMVTAYLAITGFIFNGIFSRFPQGTIEQFPIQLGDFGIIALLLDILVGILLMISVSKVSGEFRRHFSKAENIVSDADTFFANDPKVMRLLKNAWLETAAIKKDRSKRTGIRLFSNAAIHAYLFSLITAFDLYLLVVGWKRDPLLSPCALFAALIWFLIATFAQHKYINHLEATGIN